MAGWSDLSGTSSDFATIAYSRNGTPLWTNRYNGPAEGKDGASRLVVSAANAVYVTGPSTWIHGAVTNSDFATIKYIPVPDIVFTGIRPLPASGLRLTINAPTNTAYRLEASTDLANWLTLTNFPPLPRKRNNFTDKSAVGVPRRFYRTVWSP